MTHDDPAYLDGLSDLDRARAIVAVRWKGYSWRGHTYRFLGKFDPSDGGTPKPEVPPAGGIVSGLERNWGTNWTGTASLMELAESKGWRLVLLENADATCCYLRREPDLATCEHTDDTIHAAVLLACAAAAQREVSDENT